MPARTATDALHALAAWRSAPDPDAFPYDAVIAAFHRGGKHVVPGALLEALDAVRATAHPRCPRTGELARFLDTALDKRDVRFDNPSYLALEQLGLPGADDGGADVPRAAARRDRLYVLLVADVLRFELAAADGRTGLLPKLRPAARVTVKRCRHGLRAIRPALERLGLDGAQDEDDPLVAARRVCDVVASDTSAAERRRLAQTLLPVYVAHDEYMFIRVLQSYETNFALAGVQLQAAIAALADGDADAAAALISAAELALREAAPLFSLVATMASQAFLEFREFTDGASAIQSRSYKRVESVCRRPDGERLDSPAYESVPELREQVLAGQATLLEAVRAADAAGALDAADREQLGDAMQRFEATLLRWRTTHHSIAVRMLGVRRGTGYTEGVPYLAEGRKIPVFSGGCPFSGAAGGPVAAPA